MQLNIESVKTNPSGKSLVVKAGGKDYLAKAASGLLPMAGKVIDAELKDSIFNGKTNTWIEKWTPINAAPQEKVNAAQSSTPGVVPAVAAPWLPFASNTVAHAIQSGLITTPDQVKLWAAAAKQTYTELA